MFTLETKDLILRDIQPSDLQKHIYWLTEETEWWNWDASYWYLQNLKGNNLNEEIKKQTEGLKNFIEMIGRKNPDATRYAFEIEEKSSGEVIGFISCYCIDSNYENTDDDANYAFGIDIPEEKFRNKGYGYQAFSAAINYYKSHGINEVFTQTWSGNESMIQLAKKLGFKLINVRKGIREHSGQKFDALTFKI